MSAPWPLGEKHPVVFITLVPVKATAAVRTGDLRRSWGFTIAREDCKVIASVLLLRGHTSPFHARMTVKIVVVVPLVAQVTIVTASENGGEGVVIVVVMFKRNRYRWSARFSPRPNITWNPKSTLMTNVLVRQHDGELFQSPLSCGTLGNSLLVSVEGRTEANEQTRNRISVTKNNYNSRWRSEYSLYMEAEQA